MDLELIAQAADIIRKARAGIAFTGAGVSTASGIPDFRSPESGIWNNVDVWEVASAPGFLHNPQAFYNWIHPLASLTRSAVPNPAHQTLAAWERQGLINGVITQNIDGLHTAAGSRTVYELHGHMRDAVCQQCGQVVPTAPLMDQFITDRRVPRCEHCGGVMKPSVILFDDMLPQAALDGAFRAAQRADVMIIVGSSLEVAPANDLPQIALENGAALIIVNLQPTHLDRKARVALHADAAVALPAIADRIEKFA